MHQGCIYSLSRIESMRFSLEQFCRKDYQKTPFNEHLKVLSMRLLHCHESKNKID